MFVVGVYKSGTSRAVALATTSGYVDISRVDNPYEQGFRRDGGRYLTRESLRVRRINDRLVQGGHFAPFADILARLSRFLESQNGPVVLKDPRFVITLQPWMAAAHAIGIPIKAVFTRRTRSEVAASWRFAPLTRELKKHGLLEAMLSWQLDQEAWSKRQGVTISHMLLGGETFPEVQWRE
jgi:hypothetical protein